MDNSKKNLLRVILKQDLNVEIKEALLNQVLPKYHCIREFLEQCVETYETSERNYLQEEGNLLSEYGGVSALIPITPLQKKFLLSEDADQVFTTPKLSELLSDLREYSLPKVHI